jgi:hypothetical protein
VFVKRSEDYFLAASVFLASDFAAPFLASAFAAGFAAGFAVEVFASDFAAGLAVLEACAKEPKERMAAAKTSARLLKLFIVFVFSL